MLCQSGSPGRGMMQNTHTYMYIGSRDSSVGVATGWTAGLRIPAGVKISSAAQRPNLLWGPPSLLFNGYRRLFPRGINRPGREADHLPPSCAEVKNGGAIPPLPHISSWHSAWLIKYRDNFTLYLYLFTVCISGGRRFQIRHPGASPYRTRHTEVPVDEVTGPLYILYGVRNFQGSENVDCGLLGYDTA
jgi:hypothetical protein